MLVDGPEDPKLFELPSSMGWEFTFSSFPPAVLRTESGDRAHCNWEDESVQQMYFAADGVAMSRGKASVGVRLQYGNQTGKNWIPFTHENRIYFIYSVEPHVVLEVRPADGAAAKKYETVSPYLAEVARHVSVIQGSATALRYNDDEYLALFHATTSEGYSTAAYTFQASPPFAVQRVSKPLPLHNHSYATSISLQADKVLIGYGEADKSSRVLVMSRSYLEDQFGWCL